MIARPGLVIRNLLSLVVFTSLGFVSLAHAVTPQQRAQGLTAEDLEANKKTVMSVASQLSTKVAPAKSSPHKFGGMMSYGLRQDVAQERSPVLSNHRVLGNFSFTVFDRPVTVGFDDDLAQELITLNISAAAQFATLGQEVQGNVNGGPVDASDLDVSASRGFEFDKLAGASNAMDLTLGSAFPTSLPTLYEGVNAVPYANASWALGFQGGRFNITQSVSGDYTVNKYSHSPVTREVNSDSSAGYTIAGSTRLGAGFRFTIGGSARLVHHFDNTVTDALSNFQILSWTRGFATITLRHSNGSRADDHQSSLWFVDEYRRIISLGLSVRF